MPFSCFVKLTSGGVGEGRKRPVRQWAGRQWGVPWEGGRGGRESSIFCKASWHYISYPTKILLKVAAMAGIISSIYIMKTMEKRSSMAVYVSGYKHVMSMEERHGICILSENTMTTSGHVAYVADKPSLLIHLWHVIYIIISLCLMAVASSIQWPSPGRHVVLNIGSPNSIYIKYIL